MAELKPRYLILDWFGDVHFGVARLPDGRYFTDNRWKVRPPTSTATAATPASWRG